MNLRYILEYNFLDGKIRDLLYIITESTTDNYEYITCASITDSHGFKKKFAG